MSRAGRWWGCILLATCSLLALQVSAPALQPPNRLERASSAVQVLLGWFDESTGLFKTTGWWNSANVTTVLADYSRVSKSKQYFSTLAETFAAAQNAHPGFLNKYYDDEGWWALAWVDAYDLTGNKVYLSMAESIFADMAASWDSTCSGGIWWSKDRNYKNAIANELFLSAAAHLANRDSAGMSGYLDWANREWTWFLKSGMINAQSLVNDGLRIERGQTNPGTCTNNGRNTWSYNQGVVLGGLVELAKLNPDPSLIATAHDIAGAAIRSLVDANGILHDSCEPARCGADAPQFKGIFVRNLVALHAAFPRPAYKSFVEANADAVWDKSRSPDGRLGLVWSGPFGGNDASSQSSALDALIGAAAMQGSEKSPEKEP
jgi:predicted alpha-1,6-mannanase (GH76 family)